MDPWQGRSYQPGPNHNPVPALQPSSTILSESQVFSIKSGAGLGSAGLGSALIILNVLLFGHIGIQVTLYTKKPAFINLQ